MSGRPAYDRESYLEEIDELRRRGLSLDLIAARVGISRATVYRLLAERRGGSR